MKSVKNHHSWGDGLLKYLILCLIAVIVFPLLFFSVYRKKVKKWISNRYRLRIFNRGRWTYYAR